MSQTLMASETSGIEEETSSPVGQQPSITQMRNAAQEHMRGMSQQQINNIAMREMMNACNLCIGPVYEVVKEYLDSIGSDFDLDAFWKIKKSNGCVTFEDPNSNRKVDIGFLTMEKGATSFPEFENLSPEFSAAVLQKFSFLFSYPQMLYGTFVQKNGEDIFNRDGGRVYLPEKLDIDPTTTTMMLNSSLTKRIGFRGVASDK
jgi:hypothetical protein